MLPFHLFISICPHRREDAGECVDEFGNFITFHPILLSKRKLRITTANEINSRNQEKTKYVNISKCLKLMFSLSSNLYGSFCFYQEENISAVRNGNCDSEM